MDNLLWNIFEITVNLCEGFIVFYFICSFLNHNFQTPKGKIVYVFISVLKAVLTTFINYITPYDWWVIIINITCWFAISCAFLKGKIIVKLFAATLSNVIAIVTSNFVTAVLSVTLKSSPIQLYTAQGWYRVLGVLMCQTLNLLLYSLILKFANKTIFAIKKKEWLMIISVFLISSLSFGIIQVALNEAKLSTTTSIMLMMCEIGLCALNIICLYITISLNKSNRVAEELKLKEQQQKHDIQYAETVRAQYEEIRNIRHNMKQHLAVVSGLQIEGKYDEAQEYVSKISSNIAEIEMFMDVGSDFVNAILNSKLSIAKSKNINVLCSSSSNIDGINEYDLCNLIGNMLDNAIEAAEKTVNAIIEVSIASDKYKISIKVANSIAESILNKNPSLKSSKSNPVLHGFGTKTIRSISEKYNGNADFYEEGLSFVCRVELCKQTIMEKVSL